MQENNSLQNDSTIPSLKSQYQNLKDNYISSDNTQVTFIKRGTDSSEYEFERRGSIMNQQAMLAQQQMLQQQIIQQAQQILQQLSLFQKYVIFYYGASFQKNFQLALQQSQLLVSTIPFANDQTFIEVFNQIHEFLQNQYKTEQCKEFYIIHLLRWQFYCKAFKQQCKFDITYTGMYFDQNEINSPFDDIEFRYLQREIENNLYNKFIQMYGQNYMYYNTNKQVSSFSEQFDQYDYQMFDLQDEYEY